MLYFLIRDDKDIQISCQNLVNSQNYRVGDRFRYMYFLITSSEDRREFIRSSSIFFCSSSRTDVERWNISLMFSTFNKLSASGNPGGGGSQDRDHLHQLLFFFPWFWSSLCHSKKKFRQNWIIECCNLKDWKNIKYKSKENYHKDRSTGRNLMVGL